MILRANAIDTLVLAGIATSGVVLLTLRHAADADYRIIVAAVNTSLMASVIVPPIRLEEPVSSGNRRPPSSHAFPHEMA